MPLQIENEYNSFLPKSTEYLQFIRQAYIDNGLDCLYFTSDNCFRSGCGEGTLPGLLQTANFKEDPDSILTDLLTVQPDKPVMAMEYWTGWFTNWLEEEQGTNPAKRNTLFSSFNLFCLRSISFLQNFMITSRFYLTSTMVRSTFTFSMVVLIMRSQLVEVLIGMVNIRLQKLILRATVKKPL